MVQHQIDDDGTCSTCDVEVAESKFLECFKCNSKFHTECNGVKPFGAKTSIDAFKNFKKANFVFICDPCLTTHEQVAASSTKEQLAAVVAAVAKLSNEVAELKKDNAQKPPTTQNQNIQPVTQQQNPPPAALPPKQGAWDDPKRLQTVKEGVTVCIKNDGQGVNMEVVKDIVTTHGIQVNKASVSKKNGDVYIDLPSNEGREKLLPLLHEADIPGNRIVNVKQKCPTISIRNFPDYVDEEDFVDQVKLQNQAIREKIENGSEFSVVFTRQNKDAHHAQENNQNGFLVVLRVGNDVRDVIKTNGDKLFIGFRSHKVLDRFYVKSCAKCHKFGHYHADCTNNACCGYCLSEDHESDQCPLRKEKETSKFKCVNCKDANKVYEGHSSHYNKCPTFLEVQKKTMMNVPYYAKNR